MEGYKDMTTTCTNNEISVRRSPMAVIVDSCPVTALAKCFAVMLEKPVSNVEALCILNALVSFASLLLFSWASLSVACLLLLWFAVSVCQCRRVSA